MSSAKKPQTMKPETAAKKLGILLQAVPDGLFSGPVSRDEFDRLQNEPPEWLAELRRTGPHPRPIVAGKLGVSIAGLARAGVDEPLTTAEIKALLEDPPQWLVAERATQAAVREEAKRVKDRDADRAAQRTTEN